MTTPTIGLLSPGDMGHAVGGVLHANGLTVLTALDDRSPRSRALAAKAGIELVTGFHGTRRYPPARGVRHRPKVLRRALAAHRISGRMRPLPRSR